MLWIVLYLFLNIWERIVMPKLITLNMLGEIITELMTTNYFSVTISAFQLKGSYCISRISQFQIAISSWWVRCLEVVGLTTSTTSVVLCGWNVLKANLIFQVLPSHIVRGWMKVDSSICLLSSSFTLASFNSSSLELYLLGQRGMKLLAWGPGTRPSLSFPSLSFLRHGLPACMNLQTPYHISIATYVFEISSLILIDNLQLVP